MDYSAQIPPEIYQQDRGPKLVVVIWVFATFSLILIAIKVWTRFKITHQSGLEDLFIFSGWVLSTVFGGILTAAVHLGLGKHPFAIDPAVYPRIIRLHAISAPFGVLNLALPPVAIAILLNQLLDPTPRLKWILYGIPISQMITSSAAAILVFAGCKVLE
ncbi:MAG: hypothetical protein Q9174_002436 [Haloplaca sp. 1 TL-2023]